MSKYRAVRAPVLAGGGGGVGISRDDVFNVAGELGGGGRGGVRARGKQLFAHTFTQVV